MILVFGGTTEGKKVATLLEGKARPFVYATKTNIAFKETKVSTYRHGALNEAALDGYIIENNIEVIINASHPFAEILHQTIAKVAQSRGIPVIRYSRELLSKTIHPLVSYVNSYNDALKVLKNNQTLLALTGVQSINKIASWWQNNTTYFRILNRPESLAIAHDNNFPENQLILGLPSANLEDEIALIQRLKIDVVLTKETGNSGFLSTKIEAALKTKAHIIIIKQPKISSYFQVVYNLDTLELLISKTHQL